MGYFDNVKSYGELRKRYIELLKRMHPDNGGSVDETQRLNFEYDRLVKRFLERGGENVQADNEKSNQGDLSGILKDMLDKVLLLDCDIELIGKWIWAFNAYNSRNELKSLGFKYAPKRKAWVFHAEDWKRVKHGDLSIDEIREKYGARAFHRVDKARIGG